MRILDIIGSADPAHGGPIGTVRSLSRIWRARGHVFDVVTLDSPEAPYLADSGLDVVPLGSRGEPGGASGPQPLHRRFGYSPKLLPWLKANTDRYDVALVHGLWNYSSLAASLALAGNRLPHFVFTHGMLDPWFKQAYPLKSKVKALSWRVSEGRLLNSAEKVLFTTAEEQRLAEGAFRPWQVDGHVVGYGCADMQGDPVEAARTFRAGLPALGERPFLLFLSRIHPKKGCDLLLEAFARIAAAHPEMDLVFAGPDDVGLRGVLAAEAEARGIGARVHFAGMIRGAAKWGAFHACEAFALVSHSENFGVVVAEAMACSKPVLITDKINLWREVDAAGAGLIEKDDQAGADALLARFLALSPEARAAMGRAARRCYDANYQFDALADRLMALFRQAVADTPRPQAIREALPLSA
ncbi:glycosyltransferase [Sphingomonas naphthae]|uniref:Glycosyltransferase n=1 Tax=Sphingomonas naphthae TaxID=1813468 RepID=A0ABY7TP45_9SPHN|nr:glycosyltransferase [Sphingomonas naphthae]WCT73629.1 glycosyltransferase [Sphingomonas naphthae]